MKKRDITKQHVRTAYESDITIKPSDEVAICLNCTLPASACEKFECERFRKEMRKLKKKRK